MTAIKDIHRRLATQIENVYSTGLSWELDCDSVDNCLLKAIRRHENDTVSDSTTSTPSVPKPNSKIKVYALVLAVSVTGFLLISRWHPQYNIFWLARHISLSSHNYLDLSGIYESGCLVRNPFYKAEPVDCTLCSQIETPLVFGKRDSEKQESFLKSVYGTAKPALFKKACNKTAYLEVRRRTLDTWEEIKKGINCRDSRTTACDLYDILSAYSTSKLKSDPKFHFEWSTGTTAASHILKKISPSPSFIPKSSEISYIRTVVIDAPEAGVHTLPEQGFVHHWYSQSSGRRQMTLVPKSECLMDCQPLHFTMETRDTVYYNSLFWRMDTAPVTGSVNSDISVAYMGTFSCNQC